MKAGKNYWKLALVITIVLAALLLLTGGSITVAAHKPTTTTADDPSATASMTPAAVNGPSDSAGGTGDDGHYEMAVEWVGEFSACDSDSDDMPEEEDQCMGFYEEMQDAGWGGHDSYDWGNDTVWAMDFQGADYNGNEESAIDKVDIALYCDHGVSWDEDPRWGFSTVGLFFGDPDPHDQCYFAPGQAYHAYGTSDLEWLGLKACKTLRDANSMRAWAGTMYGLHGIVGFKTNAYPDDDFGEDWAEYMLGDGEPGDWDDPPDKVVRAWFEATDDTQPDGVCARAIADMSKFYNEYLPGRGTNYADTHVSGYKYWTHCVDDPPSLKLSLEGQKQITSLPILNVVPRTVTANYTRQIAAAFGFSSTEVYSNSKYYFMIDRTGVATYTLRVDKLTGSYKYRNEDEMWAAPEVTPTLPSLGMVERNATEFLAGAGAGLPGAGYRNGGARTWYEEIVDMPEPALGAAQPESPLSSMAVDAGVLYARTVSVAAGGVNGAMAVNVPVVGAGARTIVYEVDGGQILGVQGGSRVVAESTFGTVIMPAADAWNLWLADHNVALLWPPIVFDTATRLGETLAYFEQPYDEPQAALIPAWVFSATLEYSGTVVDDGALIYVPASTLYLPPEVNILTPADGAILSPGQTLTLSGEVVQHGRAPFTYEWSSSTQGVLGTGATIDVPLSTALIKGGLSHQTITLHVTDADGQKGSDTIEVLVLGNIYLPVVLRNFNP